jgi:orotidine-5'-phosphate decarboxylase
VTPPELVVALDLPAARDALRLVDQLGELAGCYKVGPVLHVSDGPAVIRALRERGKRVFLDLKWHDIPATVGSAVASAAEAGVSLATLHLAGGPRMLEAAVTAPRDGLALIGVGVLTSLGPEEYASVVGRPVGDIAAEQARLVRLGVTAGLDGYVAAAAEARAIRAVAGVRATIVVPGVRRSGETAGDQTRVATPREAARAGADLLVVGRPITASADPRREAMAIVAEAKA